MFEDNSYLEKQSLKYPDNVPKDYDISKLEFTFDFICRVLKRDESIDGAIKGVSKEYGLSDIYLRKYLIESKYILNKPNRNEFSKRLKKYSRKTLKKILKEHGLKTSGKRKRLERRLFENNILGNDYYLSSKSKVFYKNKKRRIRIFEEYLFDAYYFKEFNEFYMDNFRKKEDKIPVEFINLHIEKAIGEKNHQNYIFNTLVMAELFYKKEKCRRMLEYTLKNYCMNLNPVWKIDDLKGHTGLLMDIADNILFLENELGKNAVINTYYMVWDSFNFERIIVPKYEGYRYLKDIMNGKDLSKINEDLNRRFYCNEDLKIKRITQKTLFDF